MQNLTHGFCMQAIVRFPAGAAATYLRPERSKATAAVQRSRSPRHGERHVISEETANAVMSDTRYQPKWLLNNVAMTMVMTARDDVNCDVNNDGFTDTEKWSN